MQHKDDRLVTLDGMRGAAAMLVLIHHVWPATTGGLFVPRGYLAVDFFFMLSGFVMARTYERRFAAGLTTLPFMAARLRRLYPMIAIGICSGAAVALGRGSPLQATLGSLILELLFIPWLGGGMLGIFAFDGAQWSLLFELIANAAHARMLRSCGMVGLAMLALLSLLVLVMIARHAGGIAVGDRGMNILGGVPRVFFAYITGIILARMPKAGARRLRAPGGLTSILLLTLAILAAGAVPGRWDGWWIDIAVIVLAFPLLILWGAQGKLGQRAGRMAQAAGGLSYPLYAMHLPMLKLVLLVARPSIGQGFLLFACAGAAGIAGAVLASRLRWSALLPPGSGAYRRRGAS